MLAYAADNPRPAGRAGSPKALTLIVLGHAALISAVMMTKMDVVPREILNPIDLIKIRTPPPPPPPPTEDVKPKTDPKPFETVIQETVIDRKPPIVDMGQTAPIEVATGPTLPPLPPLGGGTLLDPPKHVPVRLGPRFATNESAVKPPYPLDKIRGQEEATLRLRLTIDARGRVTSVEPVGAADPSFLEAARRHILRAWRYRPATEDGVGVTSTTVITLSFRLEDV